MTARGSRARHYGEPVIDGAQALGWRLRRHGLHPVVHADATDSIRRVVAVRGWPAETAELAVAMRQAEPRAGTVQRALDDGELVRSYAFRGGSYVFTHETASVLLAARTATRIWETDRWQRQGGFAIDDWAPLRDAVRDALRTGPRTRAEVGAHLARIPALRHLASAATEGSGSDALYKPLHWWGDICFGPERDGQSTFRRLDDDPRWPGLPDVDEAGRRACLLHLEAYGPATSANLGYWLTEGLGVPRRRLEGWLRDLGDAVATVEVDGEAMLMAAADVAELEAAGHDHTGHEATGHEATARPDAVVLLPAYDPWVLGPGTADTRIVPAARRSLVSNGANLVVSGGVVAGIWRARGTTLAVSWFAEAGAPPTAALEEQAARVAAFRGESLSLSIHSA